MLSNRPTPQQLALQIDLGDDVDELTIVNEPQRGQSVSANAKQPSLDSFQNDLMEKIVDTDNMMKAWTNVRRNAGAPGPDGITVDEFPEWLAPRWPEFRQQLLDGTYRPAAARRKCIPKPDGSERLLRRFVNLPLSTRRRMPKVGRRVREQTNGVGSAFPTCLIV